MHAAQLTARLPSWAVKVGQSKELVRYTQLMRISLESRNLYTDANIRSIPATELPQHITPLVSFWMSLSILKKYT